MANTTTTETEDEAAERRGELYELLSALVTRHGADDVTFMLRVIFEDERLEQYDAAMGEAHAYLDMSARPCRETAVDTMMRALAAMMGHLDRLIDRGHVGMLKPEVARYATARLRDSRFQLQTLNSYLHREPNGPNTQNTTPA